MSGRQGGWVLTGKNETSREVSASVIASWNETTLVRLVIPVRPTWALLWALFKSWTVGSPVVFDYDVNPAEEAS